VTLVAFDWIRQINISPNPLFQQIAKYYIRQYLFLYAILYSLGNKKDNWTECNLADFRNSPNRQNKFYAKFSSYTVLL